MSDAGNEKKLVNNLLNITTSDPMFSIIGDNFAEAVAGAIRPDKELRGVLDLRQFRIAVADAYFMHFSFVPILRDSNPDPLLEAVRRAMKAYMGTKRFRTLHDLTALDDELSSLYSMRFAIHLARKLMEAIKKNKNVAGKSAEKLSSLANLQKKLRELKCKHGSGAKKEVRKIEEQINAVSSEVSEELARLVTTNDVIAAANKAAEETLKVARGKKRGGSWASKTGTSYTILSKAIDILGAETVSSILRHASDIVLHMPMSVDVKKRRTKSGEPYSYMTTSDPARALARELALPDDVFYAKLVSRALLAFERRSLYEGAYYVLIDKSGSMAGEKTVVARSIAFAIFELAQRRHREFYLRFFDTVVHPIVKGREASRHILTVESDGGTDIDKAIRTAIQDLKRLGDKANTIILITDGEDDVTVTRDELQRVGAELITIISGENESLRKISTLYFNAIRHENAVRLVEAA